MYEKAKNGTGEAGDTGYTINNGVVTQFVEAATITTIAVATGYVLWKLIEFVGTLPACGGCGVLSPS